MVVKCCQAKDIRDNQQKASAVVVRNVHEGRYLFLIQNISVWIPQYVVYAQRKECIQNFPPCPIIMKILLQNILTRKNVKRCAPAGVFRFRSGFTEKSAADRPRAAKALAVTIADGSIGRERRNDVGIVPYEIGICRADARPKRLPSGHSRDRRPSEARSDEGKLSPLHGFFVG